MIEARNAFHLVKVEERGVDTLRSLADSRPEIQTLLGEPIADSLAFQEAA